MKNMLGAFFLFLGSTVGTASSEAPIFYEIRSMVLDVDGGYRIGLHTDADGRLSRINVKQKKEEVVFVEKDLPKMESAMLERISLISPRTNQREIENFYIVVPFNRKTHDLGGGHKHTVDVVRLSFTENDLRHWELCTPDVDIDGKWKFGSWTAIFVDAKTREKSDMTNYEGEINNPFIKFDLSDG